MSEGNSSGFYIKRPSNKRSNSSRLYIKQSEETTKTGFYVKQPEPVPALTEDMQAAILEQDADTDEPIQASQDDSDAFLREQAAPTARGEQPEAQWQQETQEPDRYQPPTGYSRLGRNIQTGEYVDITQASRRQGLYIIGLQGYGKSGLKENLIIQDIKQQIGVCVLDPHGELVDQVLARLPDREKEEKVILLDLRRKDYYIGLNLFDCADPTDDDEITKTLALVLHVFEKAFGITQANPLMYNLLYKIAYVLIANPEYAMVDMPLFLTNEAFRKKLVQNVPAADVRTFWENWDNPKLKSPRDQEADSQTILNKLNDFSHAPLRYIVGQSTSTIDLQQIMDEGKILLVKLDRRRETATALIGSILVALILQASAARLTKKQFNLYADEFQNFATEDFATLLEQARKAGIGITMAHQNRSQLIAKNNELETDLKDRTRSTDNLVVFRINRKDADDLAGEFAQEPEEASQDMRVPQKHERKEEQVEIEVEEEVKAIPTNPVDFLVSARGTHGSTKVIQATQAILFPLVQAAEGKSTEYHPQHSQERFYTSPFAKQYTDWEMRVGPLMPSGEAQAGKQLVNTLLVDVMEERVAVPSVVLTRRVKEIVRTLGGFIGWRGLHYIGREAGIFWSKEANKEPFDRIISCLDALVIDVLSGKDRMAVVFREQAVVQALISGYDDLPGFSKWAKEEASVIVSFISNLHTLCKELATEEGKIKVPTGHTRKVLRKQPSIHYLTHESEKIQRPRRTEQDMVNEIARRLTKLPLYTAQAKVTTKAGLVELTIRTLDPKKEPGKILFGEELEERIARIQRYNRTPVERGISYCRSRHEVEEEIRQRQEQYREPPDEPPISRHPPR